MLKNGLTWHCSYPAWFTVDSNGRMMACPDWNGARTYQKSIFDMEDPGAWEEYLRDFKEDVKPCQGCAWSTTILSEKAFQQGTGAEVMTHVRRSE